MRRCITSDLNCADLCTATCNVLSRQTEYDHLVTQRALQACIRACIACAEECDKHCQAHPMLAGFIQPEPGDPAVVLLPELTGEEAPATFGHNKWVPVHRALRYMVLREFTTGDVRFTLPSSPLRG